MAHARRAWAGSHTELDRQPSLFPKEKQTVLPGHVPAPAVSGPRLLSDGPAAGPRALRLMMACGRRKAAFRALVLFVAICFPLAFALSYHHHRISVCGSKRRAEPPQEISVKPIVIRVCIGYVRGFSTHILTRNPAQGEGTVPTLEL
jgi:hypothetical protein